MAPKQQDWLVASLAIGILDADNFWHAKPMIVELTFFIHENYWFIVEYVAFRSPCAQHKQQN